MSRLVFGGHHQGRRWTARHLDERGCYSSATRRGGSLLHSVRRGNDFDVVHEVVRWVRLSSHGFGLSLVQLAVRLEAVRTMEPAATEGAVPRPTKSTASRESATPDCRARSARQRSATPSRTSSLQFLTVDARGCLCYSRGRQPLDPQIL